MITIELGHGPEYVALRVEGVIIGRIRRFSVSRGFNDEGQYVSKGHVVFRKEVDPSQDWAVEHLRSAGWTVDFET